MGPVPLIWDGAILISVVVNLSTTKVVPFLILGPVLTMAIRLVIGDLVPREHGVHRPPAIMDASMESAMLGYALRVQQIQIVQLTVDVRQ